MLHNRLWCVHSFSFKARGKTILPYAHACLPVQCCQALLSVCRTHLSVVVWDLAEQVVGDMCVSNAVEEDVKEAIAASTTGI